MEYAFSFAGKYLQSVIEEGVEIVGFIVLIIAVKKG